MFFKIKKEIGPKILPVGIRLGAKPAVKKKIEYNNLGILLSLTEKTAFLKLSYLHGVFIQNQSFQQSSSPCYILTGKWGL